MKSGFIASYRNRLKKQMINDGQDTMTYFLASLSGFEGLTISLVQIQRALVMVIIITIVINNPYTLQ